VDSEHPKSDTKGEIHIRRSHPLVFFLSMMGFESVADNKYGCSTKQCFHISSSSADPSPFFSFYYHGFPSVSSFSFSVFDFFSSIFHVEYTSRLIGAPNTLGNSPFFLKEKPATASLD